MKVDFDFDVANEQFTVKITPQDAKERVVCGALHLSDSVDTMINEDGSCELIFEFIKPEKED